jgi:hypothetical protein
MSDPIRRVCSPAKIAKCHRRMKATGAILSGILLDENLADRMDEVDSALDAWLLATYNYWVSFEP